MKKTAQLSLMLRSMQLQDSQHVHVYPLPQSKAKFPMRAIFIVLDLTKPIQMKDFKPSRLSVSVQMIKNYLKKSKEETPIIKYSFAIVEEQLCKIKCGFTFDIQQIYNILDVLKVSPQSGFFSLQNVLRSTLEQFQNVSNSFRKQLFIIQASSLTKDYRDIYQTIYKFSLVKIKVNIASLVGWTNIFQKLVQKTDGCYQTVSSPQQFRKFVDLISSPPQMLDNTQTTTQMIKIALCKKQYNEKSIECFCHLKLVQNYFICGMCEAVICKEPPLECPICGVLVIIPTDLSRHKIV